MKDKSKKHDHKGTKILKLSIFASVMLAPLFAIGFKCAYTTFNKNANQSYSANQSLTYEIEDTTNIVEGAIYYFKTDNNLNTQLTMSYINVSQFNTISGSINVPSNPYRFRIYYNPNNQSYSIQIDGTTSTYTPIGNTTNISSYQFNFISSSDMNTNPYSSNLKYYNFSEQQTLDNAFYYAIDQMKDNELFAWTKNTALYTPINAMTSGLGITTDAIAVLLAYWLYITLIYVVFDIVIELFTYLSHLIMGNPIG